MVDFGGATFRIDRDEIYPKMSVSSHFSCRRLQRDASWICVYKFEANNGVLLDAQTGGIWAPKQGELKTHFLKNEGA